MKLNVGSGHNPMAGAHNCDINPDCPVDFVCELDAIPQPDGTYSEVYSIHSIEHVPLPRAKSALREWLRVLAAGGFCHIDTPNIERNAKLYLEGGWLEEFHRLPKDQQEICSLNGVPNRTLWMIFKCFSSEAEWNVHYWNADPDLLQALCIDAGFTRTEVLQQSPSVIVRAYK